MNADRDEGEGEGKGWGEGEGEHGDEVVRQMSKIVHTRPAQLTQSPLFAIQPWDQNSKSTLLGSTSDRLPQLDYLKIFWSEPECTSYKYIQWHRYDSTTFGSLTNR